ncbi:FmdE family protein [Candidatus Bipolaricaulota bacterium]
MDTLTIDPRTADLKEMIARGTLLHGHLGPFLVAGIRMGLLALRELESPGYFGIRAESQAGQTTPLSCLNDGVQIGSGCTAGKGNLCIVSEMKPRVRFVAEDGREITIELRRKIVDSFFDSDALAKARELEAMPEEELFEWTMSSR